MKEITLQEAALAWANGKMVEATKGYGFKPISSIGAINGYWNSSVFSDVGPEWAFRVAPEPPAKRYRPWTPEEVPVGALTQSLVPHEVLMIIGRNETGVRLADDDGWYSYSALVLARTYSTDGGKTWLPCGVEVEA
jgi:hypothetical protein